MAKDPQTPAANDEGLLHSVATAQGVSPDAVKETAKAVLADPKQAAKEIAAAQAEEFAQAAAHPVETAKETGKGVVSAITNPDAQETAKTRFQQPGLTNKIAGGLEYLTSGVPLVGSNLVKAEEQAAQGNYAGSVGTAIGTAAPFVTESEPVQAAKAHLEETGRTFLQGTKEGLQRAALATAPEGSAEAGFAKINGSKKVRGATPKPKLPEPAAQNAAAGFIRPDGTFQALTEGSHPEDAEKMGTTVPQLRRQGWVRKAGQGSYDVGQFNPATKAAVERDIIADMGDYKEGNEYGQPVHDIVIDTADGTHEIPVEDFIDKHNGSLDRAMGRNPDKLAAIPGAKLVGKAPSPAEPVQAAKAHLAETGKTFVQSAKEGLGRAVNATAPEGSLEAGFAKLGGKKVLAAPEPEPTITHKTTPKGGEVRIDQGGKNKAMVKYTMGDSGEAAITASNIDPDLRGQGYGKQMYRRAAQEAQAKGAKTITSDLTGTDSFDSARVWDSLQKSHPDEIETIPSKAGSPGYRWNIENHDFEEQPEPAKEEKAPEPQFVQTLARRGQLPGQKVNLGPALGDTGQYVGGLEKPVPSEAAPKNISETMAAPSGFGTTNDPLRAGFILSDGRMVPLMPGAEHNDMIAMAGGEPLARSREDISRAESKGLTREQVIENEGTIRTRYRTSKAGNEVVFSVPSSGVSESQIEQMKKSVAAMGRNGNAVIEVGDPILAATHNTSKEFVRPSDIEPMLKEIGAHPDQSATNFIAQAPEGTYKETDPKAAGVKKLVEDSGGVFRGMQVNPVGDKRIGQIYIDVPPDRVGGKKDVTAGVSLDNATPEGIKAAVDKMAEQHQSAAAPEVSPNPELQASAQKYAKAQGMPEINHEPVPVDLDRAREIARTYEEAAHSPNDPKVKAAYDALKSETLDQFHHLKDDLGLKFEPQEKDPYSSAGEMMNDIKQNNRLKVFTGSSTGEDHPLSAVAPGTGGQTYNTVFRWVHDAMGHAAGGNDFSEAGEKSATEAHAQMYSDAARPAMRAETEGQTSWFFHNPEVESGVKQPGEFAPQKATTIPDETLEEKLKKGVSRDNPITTEIPLSKISVSERAYTGAGRNISSGAGSKTAGPVQLVYNSENGQFLVEDGMHRIVQANRNNDATIQATVHSSATDAANVAKGDKMNLEPTPWHEVAADRADENEAGGIDPRTGKSDTTGLGTEIAPEMRQPLDHSPTAADFQKFYEQHKDIFDKHPELRIGWDNNSAVKGGHELNIGAVGEGAEAVAKKLDQKSAFNIEKGETIPTGGTGLKTKFPNYPLEQRLEDLKTPSPLKPSTGGTPEAPAAPPMPKESEGMPIVSSRMPSKTVNGEPVEEHTNGMLTSDMQAAQAAPGFLQKLADRVAPTPGFKDPGGSAMDRTNAYIRHIADNVKFVWNKLKPEDIERDQQWYPVGAHQRGIEVAKQHEVDPHQVYGVTAALSPLTDWDVNTSLAERAINIWKNQQNTKFTPEMRAAANDILSVPAMKKFKGVYKGLEGKTLGELKTTEEQAHWLRLYDEAHNPREYQTWNPDGTSNGTAKNQDGSPKNVSWSFQNLIENAINILKDGSQENISKTLGAGHKVRNFYNNQLAPNDPRFLTIDTHAVNVGQLRPMSGQTTEVRDNFGGISNKPYGLKGTYALHDAGYRLAAKELGVEIPSRLQSATWTKIRELFPNRFKTPENQAAIDAVWKEHTDGKTSIEDARNKIWDYAEGWNSRTPEEERNSVDQRELFNAGVQREAAAGTAGRGNRGNAAATNPEVDDEGDTSFDFGANRKTQAEEDTAKVLEMRRTKATQGLSKSGAAAPIPKTMRATASEDDMTDPDMRFRAAQHEAAHAVISESLNPGTVTDMALDENGGRTNVNAPNNKQTVGQLSPDELRDMLATSLAGGMGEPGGTTPARASGDVKNRQTLMSGAAPETMMQGISRLVTGGSATDPILQNNQNLAAAHARVNALMADPKVRAHIANVATALTQKNKLTGDEVRAIMSAKQ